MSGSSQYKFGVLAKIVKHLKTLHQDGGDHALSLEDILDETNQLDVGMKISQVIIKCSECMVKYFFLTCLLVVTSIVVEN
jgi:hypothetical protein